jgi:hypothetical protein
MGYARRSVPSTTMKSTAPVILLGPQRLQPTVGSVVAGLGLKGPLALITAGWKEREGDDAELRQHLGVPAYNLDLYLRGEQAIEEDTELRALLRARQETLRRLQEIYRRRLANLMQDARELMHMEGDAELLDVERDSAVEAVRALDRHHLGRVGSVHADYRAHAHPAERPSLVRRRAELAARIDEAEAVLISGGHVVVLLNRLSMFDLGPLLAGKTLIAWSAGAMAASEKVVLFHDRPPQGPGNAEVLDWGLGLCRGVLPLPHASERLDLDDRVRVSLLSRRFAELDAMPLEPGTRIDYQPARLNPREGARVLRGDGRVEEAAR